MHTDEHRIQRSVYDTTRHGPPLRRPVKSLGDAFYVDLLGGRELWPTDRRGLRGTRWFLVGETLVEVRSAPPNAAPVEVVVDAPEALLERAWDAGYVVEVGGEDSGISMAIVDPAGRRIRLVQRLGR